MKLTDISKLNLKQETIDNIDVDITELVCHDEFVKKAQSKNGYRMEAICRLAKNKLPFHTTCNLAYDIIKTFVNIDCPYCGVKMIVENGGGSGNHSTVDFKCNGCKATAYLTVESDNGLYFRPKEEI